MSRSLITFLLVIGWIIYLKPEASVKPFIDGVIKADGPVQFTSTHVECRYDKKETRIPYESIAFIIND